MARQRVRRRRQRRSRRGRQGKRLGRERAQRRGLGVLHREAAGPRPDARVLDARRGHGARARRDPMAAAVAARAQGERLRALRPTDRRDGRAQPQRPRGRGVAAHARRVRQRRSCPCISWPRPSAISSCRTSTGGSCRRRWPRSPAVRRTCRPAAPATSTCRRKRSATTTSSSSSSTCSITRASAPTASASRYASRPS